MKDASTQQVAEHLKRLNPWWTSGRMDEDTLGLRPRAYLPLVRQILLEEKLRRAVVLLGPRRAGKTILIRHLIADLLERGVGATRIAYVEMDHPLLHGQSLEGLMKFVRQHRLPVAWATTRSRFGKTTIDGSEIRLWPAAALAFHYGARAVKGRLAGYEAQIQGVTTRTIGANPPGSESRRTRHMRSRPKGSRVGRTTP